MPPRVLILCTGNSARSQMAEGLLRHLTRGAMDVHSAGTLPRPDVHPLAVSTMRETYGIDISQQRPKSVEAYIGQRIDYAITVCDSAAEACPVFPGDTERIHWSFPDPAAVPGTDDEQRRAFRRVAADIDARLRQWLAVPEVAARVGPRQQ
jgi:arsenate reductase (thioredoxin)